MERKRLTTQWMGIPFCKALSMGFLDKLGMTIIKFGMTKGDAGIVPENQMLETLWALATKSRPYDYISDRAIIKRILYLYY